MTVLHFQHRAMATLFEAWLVGPDRSSPGESSRDESNNLVDCDELESVAATMWDEVDRIEQRLSRFNPASEIWRINLAPLGEAVLIDVELCEVLTQCLNGWRRTTGYFDVTAGQGGAVRDMDQPPFRLDAATRKVRLDNSQRMLDLGGYAKGYALDCLRTILERYGVGSALVSAGTSSILGIGRDPRGQPWQVSLRDPFTALLEQVSTAVHRTEPTHGNGWDTRSAPGTLRTSDREPLTIPLVDQALSCSATRRTDQSVSDVIDPHTGQPLCDQAGCVVIAPTAAEAEILSTACLCMGRARAAEYNRSSNIAGVCIGWLDRIKNAATEFEWLSAEDE